MKTTLEVLGLSPLHGDNEVPLCSPQYDGVREGLVESQDFPHEPAVMRSTQLQCQWRPHRKPELSPPINSNEEPPSLMCP